MIGNVDKNQRAHILISSLAGSKRWHTLIYIKKKREERTVKKNRAKETTKLGFPIYQKSQVFSNL